MAVESKKTDLGVCACCGGTYGIASLDGYVQMACDKSVRVGKPCRHYGKCKAVGCLLDDPASVAKQVADAESLFSAVKAAWKERGKVFLSIPNNEARAVRMFFVMLQEDGWLVGHVEDAQGDYYRLFPTETDYAKDFTSAFLSGAQPIDAAGEAELIRLRIDVGIVKRIIASAKAGSKCEGKHDFAVIRCVDGRDLLACNKCGNCIVRECNFDDEYS